MNNRPDVFLTLVLNTFLALLQNILERICNGLQPISQKVEILFVPVASYEMLKKVLESNCVFSLLGSLLCIKTF